MKGHMESCCALEKKNRTLEISRRLLSNKYNKKALLLTLKTCNIENKLLLLEVQVMRPLPSPRQVQSTIIQDW